MPACHCAPRVPCVTWCLPWRKVARGAARLLAEPSGRPRSRSEPDQTHWDGTPGGFPRLQLQSPSRETTGWNLITFSWPWTGEGGQRPEFLPSCHVTIILFMGNHCHSIFFLWSHFAKSEHSVVERFIERRLFQTSTFSTVNLVGRVPLYETLTVKPTATTGI